MGFSLVGFVAEAEFSLMLAQHLFFLRRKKISEEILWVGLLSSRVFGPSNNIP